MVAQYIHHIGIIGKVVGMNNGKLKIAITPKKTVEIPIDDPFIQAAEQHEIALVDWWLGDITEAQMIRLEESCQCPVCRD